MNPMRLLVFLYLACCFVPAGAMAQIKLLDRLSEAQKALITLTDSLAKAGEFAPVVQTLKAKLAETGAPTAGNIHFYTLLNIDLASVFHDMGDLSSGEQVLLTALDALEGLKDTQPEHYAAVQSMTGRLFLEKGDAFMAVSMLEGALPVLRASANSPDGILGPPDLAKILMTLAKAKNGDASVLPLLEEAVDCMETAGQTDERIYALALLELGETFVKQGENGKSLPPTEKGLALMEKLTGPDSDSLVYYRHFYGKALAQTGNCELALPQLSRVMAYAEANGLKGQPVHLELSYLSAECLGATGSPAQVLAAWQELLALVQANEGQEAENTLLIREKISRAYQMGGDLANAVAFQAEVTHLARTAYGQRTEAVMGSLVREAELRLALDDWGKSVACLQEADSLLKVLDMEKSAMGYHLNKLLAMNLAELDAYEKALSAIRKSTAVLESLGGKNSEESVGECFANMSVMCMEWVKDGM